VNMTTSDTGLHLTPTNTTVGSTIKGLVIGRFGVDAISIQGGRGHVIQGNFLGTDITGTTGHGDGRAGITFVGVINSQIGGAGAGEGNLISSNPIGVWMLDGGGPPVSGIVIEGNLIGTDIHGAPVLGNSRNGIEVAPNCSTCSTVADVLIADNVIAGNATGSFRSAGILVDSPAGFPAVRGVKIRGNSIFSNGRLGIDLRLPDGVNPNDVGDPDTGSVGNDGQNYPVLTSATSAATIRRPRPRWSPPPGPLSG
jgi:Right handed beta helix region